MTKRLNAHSTLLMISADPDRQRFVADAFAESALTISYAETLEAARGHAEPRVPRVVLVDEPLVLGAEAHVAKAFRSLPGGDNALLLAITGQGEEAISKLLEAGFDDCLRTPLHPHLLRRRVVNYLLVRRRTSGDPDDPGRQGEIRYRHLFENANDAIFITDMETGRILDVNRYAERWLGYSRAELLQMRQESLEAPTKEEVNYDTLVQRVTNNGYLLFERHYVTRDGRRVPAEVSSRFLSYDGRRTLLSFVRDITRRKAAEQAESLQRQLAEALSNTAAILNSTLDLDVVIQRILQQVNRVLPATAVNLMLINKENKALIAGHVGYDEGYSEVVQMQWDVHDYRNMRHMVTKHRPVIINDVPNDPYWANLDPAAWIGSYMGAPLVVKGEALGFINLDHAEVGAFNEQYADTLMAFANHAGLAIQNARLHASVRQYADDLEQRVANRTRELTRANEQLKEQINERELVQAKLENERIMLRTLIDNLPDEVFIKTVNGSLMTANSIMLEGMGISDPAEISTRQPYSSLLAAEAETIRRYENQVIQSGEPINDWELTVFDNKRGQLRHVQLTRIPLRDKLGHVVGLVGMNRDITAMRRTEASLSEIIRGAYCLLWYGSAHVTNGTVDVDTHITSEEAAKDFLPLAVAPHESYAEAWQRAIPQDDREQAAAVRDAALRAGQPTYAVEYRCKVATDETRWLREEVRVSRLNRNTYNLIGVVTDVTERKQAEFTLRRANELLEQRVRERTAELSQSNQVLRQQIAERERAEHAEREQRMLAEALSSTAFALSETLELPEVLDQVLTYAARVVPPHENASVMLIEDDGRAAHIIRSRTTTPDGTIKTETTDHHYALDGLPLLARVFNTKSPVVIPDVREEADWVNLEQTGWVRSYLCVPVNVKGSVIGFINMSSSVAGEFAEDHAERLLAFSSQAGIAIQNARLFDAVRRHAGELRERVAEQTAELETERAQLRAILDAMTEGVMYVDSQRQIRYVNPALVKLTGYDESQWQHLDWSWDTLIFNDDNEADTDTLRQTLSDTLWRSGIWHGEVRLRHKSGEVFDAQIVTTVVRSPESQVVGSVTVIRDISAEKQLESQKRRFIATASHELRTPITNLKTRLYLLQQRPEALDRHMPVLVSVTDRMRRLVDDLLDVSRFEHGVITLERENTVVQDLVLSAIEMQYTEAERHGQQITHRMPDEPLTIYIDRSRINQVLTNLIGNGINYAPDGGTIHVAVDVTEAEGQPYVVLNVQDDGIGIPEALQQEIFKPFFRVNEYNEGIGLGLSISKEIVDLHGGYITVESTAGEGTCFSVWLPMTTQAEHATDESAT